MCEISGSARRPGPTAAASAADVVMLAGSNTVAASRLAAVILDGLIGGTPCKMGTIRLGLTCSWGVLFAHGVPVIPVGQPFFLCISHSLPQSLQFLVRNVRQFALEAADGRMGSPVRVPRPLSGNATDFVVAASVLDGFRNRCGSMGVPPGCRTRQAGHLVQHRYHAALRGRVILPCQNSL